MASTRNNKTNDNQISYYLLDELLVQQAIGVIYLAHDTRNQEKLFLVTLQQDAAKSTDLSDRFQRRAETLSQLKNDSLLPILDFGVDGKRPYAVMPYRPGHFLAEKLETLAPPKENDKTEIVASLTLVKQIAAVLSVAHPAGLFHHNLRPELIYLDETGHPYLLDLVIPPVAPIAALGEDKQLRELDYQSPEQQAGKALSGRSNIFSLGVLLYNLLAGHKPALPVSEWDIFDYKRVVREIPLATVRADLTEATYTVVQNSLWQKEWSRYETIHAQLKAIELAIARESAPPPPPPPVWKKFLTNLRQPKTLKIIIPAIVLVFLLLLALMFMRGRAIRQQNATPSPAAVNQPAVTETTVLIELEGENGNSVTSTPTVIPETSENNSASEVEVLPPSEEVETSTSEPRATETAVLGTPTNNSPTATQTTSITATSTPTNTATPSPEPTESSCVPSPPFGWVRYTIQSNDSLSSLSQATGATVEQIQEINCLETILLSIGQQIWLPFSPNPTETPEAAATNPPATAVPPGDNPPPPTSPPLPSTPTAPSPPNP